MLLLLGFMRKEYDNLGYWPKEELGAISFSNPYFHLAHFSVFAWKDLCNDSQWPLISFGLAIFKEHNTTWFNVGMFRLPFPACL